MRVFIKFIFIGVINTIFYYLLYSIILYLFSNYVLAVILGNIIGILFSFNTFSKYVFEKKGNLIKFFLIYGWNIVLNLLVIKLYIIFIGENLYIAGLFATGVVALNSFILNKIYVFKG